MNPVGFAALLLATIGSQTPSPQPLAVTSVAEFNATGEVITTEMQQIVRDQASWQDLWAHLNAGVLPPPSLPAVNFTKDMLVIAALGRKDHGGYKIAVTGATEQAGAVNVEITESSPGTRCMTAMVVTSPVTVVKLPRRDGKVAFTIVKKTVDCQ